MRKLAPRSIVFVLSAGLFFACAAGVFAQTQAPFTITTASLESCVVDDVCTLPVRASGGTMPLQWQIVHGSLPPGLQLDAKHGIIAGSPTSSGDYAIQIEVSDSSEPPQKTARDFTVSMLPALALDWKKPPSLDGTTISGSVTVSNNGSSAVDLTFIVVAVNEIGKAFALGYQHFNLTAKTPNQEIPFSSQLPAGRYTVRADAIGEVPARQRIYRAPRDAGPFQVPTQ